MDSSCAICWCPHIQDSAPLFDRFHMANNSRGKSRVKVDGGTLRQSILDK